MAHFLFPSEYYESTYAIDFQKYYDLGYRGILFDIDNTLVPHDKMHDDRSRALFKKLKDIGFKVCFVSNNEEPRVKEFNDEVNVEYVYKAGKPKAEGFLKGVKKLNIKRSTTIFIGDQLFTDIWGANNAKIHSILVNPLDKEIKYYIVLKRILEFPIKKMYLTKHKIKSDIKA